MSEPDERTGIASSLKAAGQESFFPAARGADGRLEWPLSRGNVGSLSRAVGSLARGGEPGLRVVLPAVDLTQEQTEIADEGEMVPELRKVLAKLPEPFALTLLLSTGRRYRMPPPSLDLSTNDLCGLECVMCANRAPRRDPRTVDPASIRSWIRLAAAWGIGRVALTGAGEPFRDPELPGHLELAHELGLLPTVTTNGLPVTEALADRLAAIRCSVSVSIHGATDVTHERITGVIGSGAGAWRAIRRLAAARSRGRGKLSVNVSSVIQRENVEELEALVTRSRAEGATGHNLQPLNLQHGSFHEGHVLRRDDAARMATLWPRPEQSEALDRLFERLAQFRERHGHIQTSPERLRLFRKYFRNPSKESLGVQCRVGESFLAVDHLGRVKPCYRLPWELGDGRSLNLQRLWNSQAYDRVRSIVEDCPLTCMNNCFFRK